MKLRKGAGILIMTLCAAFITGLISLSAFWIFNGMFDNFSMMSLNSRAENYTKTLIARIRNGEDLAVTSDKREITGLPGFYETISYTDNGDERDYHVSVYYGDETVPRADYKFRKFLMPKSPDGRVVEQARGVSETTSISQGAANELFLKQSEAILRPDGAVGSSKQGVYMKDTVYAADNVWRMNPNNGLNDIGVITEVDGVKYIDKMGKDQILNGIGIKEGSNKENGYITFGNDLVLAWSSSEWSSSNYVTVNKPLDFKTLYSGIFDRNVEDRFSKMTGVWARSRTKDGSDVYYKDNAESEKVNFFWIGYKGDKDLPEVPVAMHKFTIPRTLHQQVIVTAEDIFGTTFRFTSKDTEDVSRNFPEGSSFNVEIVPESHYIAGTLQTTGNMIYTDIALSVTDAKLEEFVLAVGGTSNQTVKVTVVNAITGATHTVSNGGVLTVPYGSTYSATVTPDSGYLAGTLSSASGTVKGYTLITVTDATPAPPSP